MILRFDVLSLVCTISVHVGELRMLLSFEETK